MNLLINKTKNTNYSSIETPDLQKNLHTKSTFLSISPLKYKKIKKKTSLLKKVKKVTFFEKSRSLENFDSKSKRKEKLIFFGQRKSMNFDFYHSDNKSKELNIKLNVPEKFLELIHYPIEDNDMETDVEIFENALLRSYESLERFSGLFKNSEKSNF